MKCLVLILLLLCLAQAGGALTCHEAVKIMRNQNEEACLEIPRLVEEKLGFEVLKQDWLEEKLNSIVRVVLKLSVQKEVKADTAYLAYAWNPEWTWLVNSHTHEVKPENSRARDWMAGKL